MKCYLIRHSMTEGNLKKRYIGKTDEPLCEAGVQRISECMRKGIYPEVDRVYVSPMKRCIQTAQMIYPKKGLNVVSELAECDFGIFENKNYQELLACEDTKEAYQAWIDSGGTLTFPKGESREAFQKRSVTAFTRIVEECKRNRAERVALVVHGGTIMSIMEAYAYPPGNYYDFQVGNGDGYELIVQDVDTGSSRAYTGSNPGRSQMDVSSGQADGASDYIFGTNYQRLAAKDEMV